MVACVRCLSGLPGLDTNAKRITHELPRPSRPRPHRPTTVPLTAANEMILHVYLPM